MFPNQNVFVHPDGQLCLMRPEKPRQVGCVGPQVYIICGIFLGCYVPPISHEICQLQTGNSSGEVVHGVVEAPRPVGGDLGGLGHGIGLPWHSQVKPDRCCSLNTWAQPAATY